jgi:hypothetical protein
VVASVTAASRVETGDEEEIDVEAEEPEIVGRAADDESE